MLGVLGKLGPFWARVPHKMEIQYHSHPGLLVYKCLEQSSEAARLARETV